MSFRPIDLQTLFSHLNQIGREKAVEQNAVNLKQSQQAGSMIKETEHRDHSINEAEKTQEELDVVGDGENRNPSNGRSSREEEEEEKKHHFQDPDLGHNIDIKG